MEVNNCLQVEMIPQIEKFFGVLYRRHQKCISIFKLSIKLERPTLDKIKFRDMLILNFIPLLEEICSLPSPTNMIVRFLRLSLSILMQTEPLYATYSILLIALRQLARLSLSTSTTEKSRYFCPNDKYLIVLQLLYLTYKVN